MAADVSGVGGRPRDEGIDKAVMRATLKALARSGLGGLSMAKIAADAGTTRTAIYRRWPTKTDLAVAAVARLAEVDTPKAKGDPFADLVAELEHFRRCITDAGSLSLAGAMLNGAIEPQVRRAYLDRIVAPRRARLAAALRAGIEHGQLPADADLAQAAASLTGSWYAYHLADEMPPRDWPMRAARLAWIGCGGNLQDARPDHPAHRRHRRGQKQA